MSQFKRPAACRSVTDARQRNEHEYTPRPVQCHRHRGCREHLTPVVCDRRLHMPVLAEGLQTQGCHFVVEEKIGCLTLNAYGS